MQTKWIRNDVKKELKGPQVASDRARKKESSGYDQFPYEMQGGTTKRMHKEVRPFEISFFDFDGARRQDTKEINIQSERYNASPTKLIHG